MKKDLHPTYNKEAAVKCGCGEKFTVGATQEKYQLDICSNCHPFYTGKQNLIDTAGRVERFKARMSQADAKPKKKKERVKKVKEEVKIEA